MGRTIAGHGNCTVCHPDLEKKGRKGKKIHSAKDRRRVCKCLSRFNDDLCEYCQESIDGSVYDIHPHEIQEDNDL